MAKIISLIGLLVALLIFAVVYWTGIVYLFWNILVVWAFSVPALTLSQAFVLGAALAVFSSSAKTQTSKGTT
jgi:hypothetical protein